MTPDGKCSQCKKPTRSWVFTPKGGWICVDCRDKNNRPVKTHSFVIK